MELVTQRACKPVLQKSVSRIQFKVSTAHCLMRFATKNDTRKSNDRSEILSKGFLREKVWFVLKDILESRTQRTQGNNNNYLFLKELFIYLINFDLSWSMNILMK